MAELSASQAKADPDIASAAFRAMCESFDNPMAIAIAGTASHAAQIAIPAPMPMPGRLQQVALIGAAALGVTNDTATKTAIAVAMRRDYLLLVETADAERWTHDTSVSPALFGPLWPDGEPEGWPPAG